MSSVESSSAAVLQQSPTSTLPLLGAGVVASMQISAISTASTSSGHGSSSSGGGIGGGSGGNSSSLISPLPMEPELMNSGEAPPAKKQKLEANLSGGGAGSGDKSNSTSNDDSGYVGAGEEEYEKLEHRLTSILSCSVCLDLPRASSHMYQCHLGHLMCTACFNHLLADGRLRDQIATCPKCRVEISKSTASRNLAVENAVLELPIECQFCSKQYPYKAIAHHEQNICDERPTDCKFSPIGCQWRGAYQKAREHESLCLHPQKPGIEVLDSLKSHFNKIASEKKLFGTLVDMLSCEKVIINDLQMKSSRTDDYLPKLNFETMRSFNAFSLNWAIKGCVNNSQKDPHQSNERNIAFQLILKSKPISPINIQFMALKGPFSDLKLNAQIYNHKFTETNMESDYCLLPLYDNFESNRLLSGKTFNFRLVMVDVTVRMIPKKEHFQN